MRTATRACATLAVLLLAVPLAAEIDTLDNVPAATLLLPYFEVELTAPATVETRNTTFTIGNASASPALAHVTLWTDVGVPTFSFDVYLTGYDVEIINLRLLFNGVLPVTADAGSDPTDRVSPRGTFSQESDLAGGGPCGSSATLYERLSADAVTALQAAHTGRASTLLGGSCGGTVRGDGLARGFVTVDSVTSCSTLLPTDPTYFQTVTDTRNVLFGEYWVIDPANNFEHADALVAVEASASDPRTDGAGDYTFYGRLASVNGSGVDHREGLPTLWEGRFLNGGVFDGGTDAIVWRDTWPQTAFACGNPPAPVGEAGLLAFDEQENLSFPAYRAAYFGLASQRVALEDPSLMLLSNFGYLAYNLRRAAAAPPFGGLGQAHVTHVFSASGRFQVGMTAWALDSITVPGFYIGYFNRPACCNGVDDDGDLLVDYPADPGCRDLMWGGENPQCNNGKDDDGDGFIDMDDPQCTAPWDPAESYL